MKIVTNNQPRDILTWYDLTPEEQKEFDYLEDGEGSFFRYKNLVYDLGEFVRVDHTAIPDKWQGYASDSCFSGVLVRLVVFLRDCDQVIVGRYFC